MANFTGDILNNVVYIAGSSDGYGEFSLAPTQLAAAQDGYGNTNTVPPHLYGNQHTYAQHRLTALPASGINPIPHYALSCLDNVGTRHYWVDTSISLTNAPVGFAYLPATLVVDGKF